MRRIIMVMILVFLSSAGAAQAFDLDDLDIHAFGSIGYLKSDYNNYLVESEKGSFEFGEAGINFTTAISDNARIGLQLFARDLGDIGNYNVVINWASLDYQWKEALGLRIGKMQLPENLYNDIRDYDMLRTSIILPPSVYNEYYRDSAGSYQGAGLYGNLSIGPVGRLGYDAYGGTIGIPSDGGFAKILSTSEVTFLSGTVDYMVGGRLRWYTPLQGLMLGGSAQQLAMRYDSLSTSAPVTIDGEIPEMHRIFGFLEYNRHDWTVAAEYMGWEYDYTSQADTSQIGQPNPEPVEGTVHSEGYYALIAYRFADWFEAGTYYSVYYPDKNDRDGNKQVEVGKPAYTGWQKDLAISTRFDITDFWLVKLEAHLMDGVALCAEIDNPDGFERYWTLYAIKTTFYF